MCVGCAAPVHIFLSEISNINWNLSQRCKNTQLLNTAKVRSKYLINFWSISTGCQYVVFFLTTIFTARMRSLREKVFSCVRLFTLSLSLLIRVSGTFCYLLKKIQLESRWWPSTKRSSCRLKVWRAEYPNNANTHWQNFHKEKYYAFQMTIQLQQSQMFLTGVCLHSCRVRESKIPFSSWQIFYRLDRS